MSEENKRLARRALEEIYAKGALDAVDALVHPEVMDHEPPHPQPPLGPHAERQTVERLHGTFSVRHTYWWRIADGRIAEHWGSRDDVGLLTQLGLSPGWD